MATKFSWKIFTKKLVINALAVLIVGGASVWTNNPYWLVALPVIKAIENYIKNK